MVRTPNDKDHSKVMNWLVLRWVMACLFWKFGISRSWLVYSFNYINFIIDQQCWATSAKSNARKRR